VPEWVRKRAAAEVSPGEALAGFSGTAALVRYEEPSAHHPVPGGLETITVPGRWVRGARDYPELMGAALDWLERITDGARDYGARNLSPC